MNIQFDNSYSRLPPEFFERIEPAHVSAPKLVFFNKSLAEKLNLSAASDEELAAVFSGNIIPEGAAPIAMAYAGHQFGHFVPQLGDGRALLLGEVVGKDGLRFDIHFKGSGPTPFSRRGDGLAALGPVLRELIVSEAMFALGIRTTRTLAVVTTGEVVVRHDVGPHDEQPGAVLTRVAASHIRIGTFQYFAARENLSAVKALADHVIQRHYPVLASRENPYLGLLESVVDAQAKLIASWMHIGFIHGVMNTDNMTISGETIDYGPCAFMDSYISTKVYSSIDRNGRYAYSNQPMVAQWNLARFAETILPLIDIDQQKAIPKAEELLHSFKTRYEKYWLIGMRRKLGLTRENPEDLKLINDLLLILEKNQLDFTNSFVELANILEKSSPNDVYGDWIENWRKRASEEASLSASVKLMKSVNPVYIPRNHRIAEVIEAAVVNKDYSKLTELMTVLSEPFNERPQYQKYTSLPTASEVVEKTFCGT